MEYIISKEKLLQLLEAKDTLDLLEKYGVDNWCGYFDWDEDDFNDLDEKEILADYKEVK